MLDTLTILLGSAVWVAALAHRWRKGPRAPRQQSWSVFGVAGLFVLQGALAAEVAVGGYHLAELLGPGANSAALDEPSVGARLWHCVAQIGLVEEVAKWSAFVALWHLLGRWRRSADVVWSGALLTVGFAATESLVLSAHLSGTDLWARALTGPFVHMLLSGFWVLGWAWAACRKRQPVVWSLGGLVLAIAAHGAYDFLALDELLSVAAVPALALLWFFLSREAQRLIGNASHSLPGHLAASRAQFGGPRNAA
jgi:RsiW-degrading membrane proteinase PrsW (M82 family)